MYWFWKRTMDIVFSAGALMILAVPMLVIAAAVKVTSAGPVLFWQKRIGKNKRSFLMPKFRSMYTDAPSDEPTHRLNDPEKWITPVGKLIRRTSLDELPQLWSVLIGDMSTVGPRPALWNQEDLIAARDTNGSNDIRPGITGLAQISGRDTLPIDQKARLDGEYTAVLKIGGMRAFFMDMKCFFGTVIPVIRHKGVVEGGTGKQPTEKKDTAGL